MSSLANRWILWSILNLTGALFAQSPEQEADAPTSGKEVEEAAGKTKKKKEKKKGPPPYYASLGLGKTLPEGFYRIRLLNRIATGTAGYDAEGKKEDFGYALKATGHIFSIEYGMSDRFNFLVIIPYTSQKTIDFNKDRFRSSTRYKNAVSKLTESFKTKVAANLENQGLCNGTACTAQVEDMIQSNSPLPAFPFTLPTGEQSTIPAAPVQSTLNLLQDMVTNAGTPADGATGLGDIDFGIGYAPVVTPNTIFNFGIGIRMPFGKFEDVPAAQSPTGEGLILLGLRLNYDYRPFTPLWLSWQNLTELMIFEGRRKKSSLLNPNELNKGDPTSQAAIDAGSDGFPNTQQVSRKGTAQLGTFRADIGLAALSSVLQPFAAEASFNYRLGAAEYVSTQQTSSGERRYSYTVGLKLDGLGFSHPVPAALRVLRENFISGENVPLATDATIVEVVAYKSF